MRKFFIYLFLGVCCSTSAFGAEPAGRTLRTTNTERQSGEVKNISRQSVTDDKNTVSRTTSNETMPRSVINTNKSVGARSGIVQRTGSSVINQRSGAGLKNLQSRSVPVITTQPTGQNISVRAAKKEVSAESIASAKEVLEQTAQLNKSCQDQYNECMDQFCAVVDTNQKRCSCSANLSNYAKVEEAVTNANAELNEVAQRIRYVGLSADEISAIMSATEAEEALDGKKDTTETRSMLDDIEKLIKDPTASASYYSSSASDFGLDMDLDFSADSSDMFSLDFLGTDTGNSISNKRGVDLYNVARKRCTTVLNECKKAGGTTQQITGNYDLAIDKDCIAYEQGLSKMNDTLVSNVRSANLLLQKARLAVLQNKTQYDARGCIGALETCMLDDMVCGSDYFKCVDPTKKYIDENGQVVLGQDITNITGLMTSYDASNVTSAWVDESSSATSTDADGKYVAQYLMSKIGTSDTSTGVGSGLCRPVLDKCQQYTYVDGVYQKYNDIVVNYIQRALTNIRSAQSKIISDYASSCMVDVASCYNQQVTQVNVWTSAASVNNIRAVMSGACRNVALTCAYAVFANDSESCLDNDGCLENISQMFYQSLLCPEHSTYTKEACSAMGPDCANTQCKCNDGFDAYAGSCVVECQPGETRVNGVCTKTNN